MIEIDEQSLQGKPINQLDENNLTTGVWVHSSGFTTCKNGKWDGWRFSSGEKGCWLHFYTKDTCIIYISITKETNKISTKTITI